MRCVVCGAELQPGEERYPNAWEASLRERACCGQECAAAFDLDEHWMPSRQPSQLEEDESQRLIHNGKQRLQDGDDPSMVARDLLVAGIAPWIVRKALHGAGIAAQQNRRTARSLSLMTLLGGFLWLSRDKRDPRQLGDAQADVDAWEARFGGAGSRAAEGGAMMLAFARRPLCMMVLCVGLLGCSSEKCVKAGKDLAPEARALVEALERGTKKECRKDQGGKRCVAMTTAALQADAAAKALRVSGEQAIRDALGQLDAMKLPSGHDGIERSLGSLRKDSRKALAGPCGG